MGMIDAALEYIGLHLPVLPLHSIVDGQCSCDNPKCDSPGKHPRTAHGLKDATILEITAREYWAKWPDANIGVRTDGLIVLDFDPRHNGYESLNKLREKYGPFPETRSHQTGGGGLHLIYRSPNRGHHGNATDFCGYQGLDIRADGGYICAAPSNHISGNFYEVLDPSPIADCPPWLAELLAKRGKPVRIDDAVAGYTIVEGRRNASLASIAGAMRRQGCSQPVIETTLLEINRQQCNPPLAEKDVLRIAKSIARYEPEPFATEDPEGEANGPYPVPDETFDDCMLGDPSEVMPFDCFPPDPPSSNTIDIDGGVGRGRAPALQCSDSGRIVTNSNNIVTPAHHIVTLSNFGDKGNNSNKSNIGDSVENKGVAVVKEWLEGVHGSFEIKNVWQELGITSQKSKHYLRIMLNRLVSQGILTIGNRDGTYRKVDASMAPVDWQNADTSNSVNLRFPFGIEKYCKIYPRSIIVVAGSKSAGKTAFLYNMVYLNMNGPLHVDLFNSETGPEQIKERLMGFPIPVPAPFTVYQRYDAFADVINPENLSVIDYLDLGSEVYLVGTEIDAIFRKLTTGVAVIGMQKAPPIVTFVRGQKKVQDRDLGYGGAFSAKRAVLYISMGSGKLKLVYVKTPADNKVDANNKCWTFRYGKDGVHFEDIKEFYEEETTQW